MQHHSAEVTALESVRIKMVTQLALDGMHMFYLGLGKFIASALFNREVRDGIDLASLCAEYAKYAGKRPREFARSPRSLSPCSSWKATESRQFLLYCAVVLLYN